MPEPTPPGCIPYKKLAWNDFPVRDERGGPSEQAKTVGRITFCYKHEWREGPNTYPSQGI